jgi:hypothetical protein
MATLTFTVDEALNVLWANDMLPQGMKHVKADRDGLQMTVAGGIEILIRQESFANGVLRLSYSSKSWAFKLADKAGMIEKIIDEKIAGLPFLRRQGKSLAIDLNLALQGKVKGITIRNFELRDSRIYMEFQ